MFPYAEHLPRSRSSTGLLPVSDSRHAPPRRKQSRIANGVPLHVTFLLAMVFLLGTSALFMYTGFYDNLPRHDRAEAFDIHQVEQERRRSPAPQETRPQQQTAGQLIQAHESQNIRSPTAAGQVIPGHALPPERASERGALEASLGTAGDQNAQNASPGAVSEAGRVDGGKQQGLGDERGAGGSGSGCSGGCGVHGLCEGGRCRCTKLYSGLRCSHPIFLTWPFVPDVMKRFSTQFEGEYVMHQHMNNTVLKVFLADKVAAGMDVSQARRVIADKATLAALRPLLPPDDTIVKGRVYNSCALVGPSPSLLAAQRGAEIDAHDMVMRFNAAPTKGYEQHVGSRTTHRITNSLNWGFHELSSEAVLVPSRSPSVIKGLQWNAAQPEPWPVWALHPDWTDYMASSFRAFTADTGLHGLVLALHRCLHVDLYGLTLGPPQGLPAWHYHDPCAASADPERDAAQWEVFWAMLRAGLARFAEPCVAECHDEKSPGACDACRKEAGWRPIELPPAENCDAAQAARGRHMAPWQTKAPEVGSRNSTAA